MIQLIRSSQTATFKTLNSFFLDLVSEYQQYQDATIDDDEYFEGDEVEQEEA